MQCENSYNEIWEHRIEVSVGNRRRLSSTADAWSLEEQPHKERTGGSACTEACRGAKQDMPGKLEVAGYGLGSCLGEWQNKRPVQGRSWRASCVRLRSLDMAPEEHATPSVTILFLVCNFILFNSKLFKHQAPQNLDLPLLVQLSNEVS